MWRQFEILPIFCSSSHFELTSVSVFPKSASTMCLPNGDFFLFPLSFYIYKLFYCKDEPLSSPSSLPPSLLFFLSVWTYGFMIYSLCCNLLALLFILMLKVLQIWSVRALPSCFPFICSLHSLNTSNFLEQDVPGLSCVFSTLALESDISLKSPGSSSGGWYLEAKIGGVLIVTGCHYF